MDEFRHKAWHPGWGVVTAACLVLGLVADWLNRIEVLGQAWDKAGQNTRFAVLAGLLCAALAYLAFGYWRENRQLRSGEIKERVRERERRQALGHVADDLENIESICSGAGANDLCIRAGTLVQRCRELGGFSRNPLIEAAIDAAVSGNTEVQRSLFIRPFPSSVPQYHVLWQAIDVLERVSGEARQSDEQRPMAIQACRIIAKYVRQALDAARPNQA